MLFKCIHSLYFLSKMHLLVNKNSEAMQCEILDPKCNL